MTEFNRQPSESNANKESGGQQKSGQAEHNPVASVQIHTGGQQPGTTQRPTPLPGRVYKPTTETAVETKKHGPGPMGEAAQKRQHLEGLGEADRNQIAGRWKLKRDDPKLLAAFENEESFQFFRALSPDRRQKVSVEEIQKGQKISESDWLSRRTQSLATFEPGDQQRVAKQWMLPANDPRCAAAFENNEQYQYFRAMEPAQRLLISADDIRQRKQFSAEDWKGLRRQHQPTLTPEDIGELTTDWGLTTQPEKAKAVFGAESSYQFFRGLSPDQRSLLEVEHITAAQPVEESVWRQLRMRSVLTMNEQDKKDVAADLGLTVTSNVFKAIMTSDAAHQFYLALAPENRKVATAEMIKTRTEPSGGWQELRWRSLSTMTQDDRVAYVDTFDIADGTWTAAMAGDKNFAKLHKIAADDRKYVKAEDLAASGNFAKNRDLRVTQYNKNAKKRVDEKKRKLNAEEWKKIVATTRSGVQADSADLVDYKWETEFTSTEQSHATALTNPDMNVTNQGKKFDAAARQNVVRERKRRAIEDTAKTEFAKLRHVDMVDVKAQIMKDDTKTIDDFRTLASLKLAAQRNPTDLKVWARWMKLKLFDKSVTPFERMSQRLEWDTHISVDMDALQIPPIVTDATTPEQLLDGLFIATGDKFNRIHVSLETGYSSGPDTLKLPHLYWNGTGGSNLYELKSGNYFRWNTNHTVADIKGALDDAYTEMVERLKVRAKAIIDKGGEPT
jgi:hypothetical protein